MPTAFFAALGGPRRALLVDLLAQRDRTGSELAAQLPPPRDRPAPTRTDPEESP